MTQFDIVIPVGPNDISSVTHQLEYTKKNIIGYRNIYLISYDPKFTVKDCITIDERIFPFTLATVAGIHGKSKRNGWYLQQLLKLYAGFVIPDILNAYLVIDSDTYFLKPTTFIADRKYLFNYGDEYNKPYFNHLQRVHPSIKKEYPSMSGICHHMIYDRLMVKQLFQMVEKHHSKAFWRVFLEEVAKEDILRSGASEYEMYFNYMIKYHPDRMTIRPLKWTNFNRIIADQDYDYVSVHWYMR